MATTKNNTNGSIEYDVYIVIFMKVVITCSSIQNELTFTCICTCVCSVMNVIIAI